MIRKSASLWTYEEGKGDMHRYKYSPPSESLEPKGKDTEFNNCNSAILWVFPSAVGIHSQGNGCECWDLREPGKEEWEKMFKWGELRLQSLKLCEQEIWGN